MTHPISFLYVVRRETVGVLQHMELQGGEKRKQHTTPLPIEENEKRSRASAGKLRISQIALSKHLFLSSKISRSTFQPQIFLQYSVAFARILFLLPFPGKTLQLVEPIFMASKGFLNSLGSHEIGYGKKTQDKYFNLPGHHELSLIVRFIRLGANSQEAGKTGWLVQK